MCQARRLIEGPINQIPLPQEVAVKHGKSVLPALLRRIDNRQKTFLAPPRQQIARRALGELEESFDIVAGDVVTLPEQPKDLSLARI